MSSRLFRHNVTGSPQVRAVLTLYISALTLTLAAQSQKQPIDTQKSVLTVHVYKAGVFSAFGHDHEIAAPIAHGTVNIVTREVELYINTAALEVRDASISDKDRKEIQSTMLGPDVLDARANAQLIFRSTTAETTGASAWRLNGDLTVHGETRPVIVRVRENSGHYVGTSTFKQTDFGIKPIKVAGGLVRVKDEIQIEFDVQLAR